MTEAPRAETNVTEVGTTVQSPKWKMEAAPPNQTGKGMQGKMTQGAINILQERMKFRNLKEPVLLGNAGVRLLFRLPALNNRGVALSLPCRHQYDEIANSVHTL
eukprot:Rmarinus@m.22103